MHNIFLTQNRLKGINKKNPVPTMILYAQTISPNIAYMLTCNMFSMSQYKKIILIS